MACTKQTSGESLPCEQLPAGDHRMRIEDVATRVQAFFRGISVRRRMKLALVVQRLYRGHAARQALKRPPKRTFSSLEACARAAAESAECAVASIDV